MTHKSPKVQLQFINQALAEAQSQLSQVKSLVRELEDSLADVLPSPRDLPGIIGKFDGTYLVTDDGKKFQVPENYAGKSKLVYGDTLKMIEGPQGEPPTFKQIERVARTTLTGVLVKKDGKLVAVTSDGSHALIPAAVSFHHGAEGDEVKVIVPEDSRNCAFAALDEIPSRAGPKPAAAPPPPVPPAPKPPEPSVKKEPVKVKEEPKPKKEKISSLSPEPEPLLPPAPKPAAKKSIEPPPPTRPIPPKAPPAAPLPTGGPVNSILADDDLR
jgi:hypothetical protein